MSTRRRYIALGALALIIAAVLIWRREYGGDARPAAANIAVQIEALRRLAAAEDKINETYAEQGYAYAQAMVEMLTLKPKGEAPRAFVDRVVRSRFGGAANLPADFSLTTGTPQVLSEGMVRVPADLSFTARSDRQVLDILAALGLPQMGFSWDEVTLLADNRARKVTVSGRISAFVVEPVE
jgi:hypothetical protein